MMIQSYYTGLSGMQSTQRAINVEADNIANVNTTGFRGSYAEFSSLYSESLHTVDLNSSVDSSNGIGSRVSTTSMVQGDGALELTNRSTDLAISGDGFFKITSSTKIAIVEAISSSPSITISLANFKFSVIIKHNLKTELA